MRISSTENSNNMAAPSRPSISKGYAIVLFALSVLALASTQGSRTSLLRGPIKAEVALASAKGPLKYYSLGGFPQGLSKDQCNELSAKMNLLDEGLIENGDPNSKVFKDILKVWTGDQRAKVALCSPDSLLGMDDDPSW